MAGTKAGYQNKIAKHGKEAVLAQHREAGKKSRAKNISNQPFKNKELARKAQKLSVISRRKNSNGHMEPGATESA